MASSTSFKQILGSKPPLPDADLKSKDTARYIRVPDVDFSRPYLGVVGGAAFVWPLGVEGFEIRKEATLGKHKYIGAIEIDVEVTHRSETNISMTGIFPGDTSVTNMRALGQVFDTEAPRFGKVLHLPGIMAGVAYVVCESLTSSHADEDNSRDIQYALNMVRVGEGALPAGSPGIAIPPKPPPTGYSQFRVTATINTLRKIAQKVYGDMALWTHLYAIDKNAIWFRRRSIPTHLIPEYVLPIGLIVYY